MEVGVFSSASTSLTPFLLLFLGFLSLSLFWSFWLFFLFLLSDLGSQFLLIFQLLQEAVEVEGVAVVHGGLDVLQVFPHGGIRRLRDHERRPRGRPRFSSASPTDSHGCHIHLLHGIPVATPRFLHVR